ncbi:MAG: L-threonylcarbamoyladenylate synthase [Candidatus Saccharimonadales bacterium]
MAVKNFHDVLDFGLVELINRGAVGVLPTDTVYGLVAKADNLPAVKNLYKLKSRADKPGTIIAASIDQLVDLGIKRRYLTAVSQFWPGAVSVILPVGEQLHYLSQNLPTLAMRLPAGAKINQLLEKTGPLLTTSANLPGQPPAENIAQAKNYFGARLDFYADGGDLAGRQNSTIIRIIDDAVEIVRAGAAKI